MRDTSTRSPGGGTDVTASATIIGSMPKDGQSAGKRRPDLTDARHAPRIGRRAGRRIRLHTLTTPELRNDMAATATQKRWARRVSQQLAKDFPDAECSLTYDTPLQLLVATILSAQCTDERVNAVTPGLFERFPTADDFARVRLGTLEKAIKPTGFFRNKAKNIKACCQVLAEEYDGEVPDTLEELVQLPGVGRKTANVVLGVAYGIATGVVVDTHVGRLSRRLGLTCERDAVKVERDLIEQLPKKDWIAFSHRMILHGRAVCGARRPKCDECSLEKSCPRVDV